MRTVKREVFILLLFTAELLLSKPASHSRDESGSFPAAVLRQQEVDGTPRSQFSDGLVHDPRETRQRREILHTFRNKNTF